MTWPMGWWYRGGELPCGSGSRDAGCSPHDLERQCSRHREAQAVRSRLSPPQAPPNRRAWRSGSMVHWWLRSYKDTDYCIKHKDKSNERIMLRLTQTPPRSTT